MNQNWRILAIFPVTGAPAEACEAAVRAVAAARAGMAHLDAVRHAQGLPPLPFGAALHLGEILWGNIYRRGRPSGLHRRGQPGQPAMNPITVAVNVAATDPSQGQIAADLARAIDRASRNRYPRSVPPEFDSDRGMLAAARRLIV